MGKQSNVTEETFTISRLRRICLARRAAEGNAATFILKVNDTPVTLAGPTFTTKKETSV